MYFGCDLSINEYTKEFEKLGYTHEESVGLAKNTIQWLEETKELKIEISDEELERIADEFNRIGCTSFRLTPEECKGLLNKEKELMLADDVFLPISEENVRKPLKITFNGDLRDK